MPDANEPQFSGYDDTTVAIPVNGTTPAAPALTSEGVLAGGRHLAQQTIPLQLAGLLDTQNELRARSTGSTAANFPYIVSQLNDLRKQYAQASRALGRRLGPGGGGFHKRGKSQLLGQAAQQYGGLIGGQQQQAFAGLLNTLSGTGPFLSAPARAPQVATAPGAPTNPAIAGATAVGLSKLLERALTSNGAT